MSLARFDSAALQFSLHRDYFLFVIYVDLSQVCFCCLDWNKLVKVFDCSQQDIYSPLNSSRLFLIYIEEAWVHYISILVQWGCCTLSLKTPKNESFSLSPVCQDRVMFKVCMLFIERELRNPARKGESSCSIQSLRAFLFLDLSMFWICFLHQLPQVFIDPCSGLISHEWAASADILALCT